MARRESFDSPRFREQVHKKEVLNLQNKIEELLDEIASKNREIRNWRQELSDATSKQKDLKQLSAEVQKMNEHLEESLGSLEKQYSDAQRERDRLKMNLDEARKQAVLQCRLSDQQVLKLEANRDLLSQSKERERRLCQQLRDESERISILEEEATSMEGKIKVHLIELSMLQEDLCSAHTTLTSERSEFRKNLEDQKEYFERLLTVMQGNLASSEKQSAQEKEENVQLIDDLRTKLSAERECSDAGLRSLMDAREKDVQQLKGQLSEVSMSASQERNRHICEIQLLMEKQSSELCEQKNEHDNTLAMLKQQHELELCSLNSQMQQKDKRINGQNQEIEQLKIAAKNNMEMLIKMRENETHKSEQWEQERLLLLAQNASIDSEWRKLFEKMHAEAQLPDPVMNSTSPTSSSTNGSSLRATAGADRQYADLDETLDLQHEQHAEPTLLEQQSVDVRKPVSFVVPFDDDDESYCEDRDQFSFVSENRTLGRKTEPMVLNDRNNHLIKPESYSYPARAAGSLVEPLLRTTDKERIEALRQRNKALNPWLRSSYIVEMGEYLSPSGSEKNMKV